MTAVSLKAVVASVLKIDPAQLDEESGMNLTENWNSLSQFMIMIAVEREFDAELAIRDIEEVATLGAIRAFLLRQGIGVAD